MQNPTFTQKLFRQRHFLSALLPLLTLLVGLGIPNVAMAQGPAIDDIGLTLSQKPTTASSATTVDYAGTGALDAPYTGYTKLGSTSTSPVTTPPNLGTYDISGTSPGVLALTGSSLVAEPLVIRGVTYNPTVARVRYRVILNGTPAASQPTFSTLTLNNAGPFPGFPAATLFNITTNVDLLAGSLGSGVYTIETAFEAEYSNGTTQTAIGNPYTATFSVNAPPITPPGGTSTWISTTGSGGSTNWTLASNWSNGVPTRFSDAIIPGKDVSPTGVAPVLNDPNTAYEVRTLTLQNSSNSQRATLTITTATLRIYGDLNQGGGGLTSSSIGNSGIPDPTQNSTIVFAGGNQVIRGQLTAQDVRIEGTGVKSVVTRLTIFNTLIMNPGSVANGVLLQTATESSSGGIVPVFTLSFDTSTSITIDLNGSGQLLGPEVSGVRQPAETNVTFVQGVMRSNRVLRAGVTEKFGNIGLDITPDKPTSSDVIVTRIVGDALNGPTTSSATAIKRQFQVVGEVNSTAATLPIDRITSTIVFHYLDSSSGYNELNGNNTESNLVLFRTVNNGVPFIPQGGSANPAENIVTRTGLVTINTVTLGDRTNPLPVTVAAFDAKRIGTDALVTWQTASEQNNKGFNVQVSTNGTEYRTLGFVNSNSANSTTAQNYSFTDTEKNKSGLRYYRLQQVDFDGKSAYFTPLTVAFDKGAVAVETKLAAYPNPFTSNVHLTLNAVAEGQALVRITDLSGRAVGQRTIALVAGSNDVELANLSDLKGGIYMMRITLPGGVSQNLKVVKE